MTNINVLKNSKENTNLIIEKLLKQEQKEHPGEEIKIIEIKSGVYGVEFDTGNINYYLNSDGEVIASYSGAFSAYKNYNDLLKQLGYKEEKILTEYVMTRIKDNSKVDKYSIEYFNIAKNLDFVFSLKYLDEAKTSKKRLSRSQALELLPTFISAGSLKLNELETFLTRGSITRDDFDTFLPKMRILLKEQTIDVRGNMKKFGKEVTEEEIKDYYKKGYIDQNLAKELYEIIKKNTQKSEKKEEIKKNTQSSLEIEKNNFVV